MAWMCFLSTWPLPSALSRKSRTLAHLLLLGVLVHPCTLPFLWWLPCSAAKAYPGTCTWP